MGTTFRLLIVANNEFYSRQMNKPLEFLNLFFIEQISAGIVFLNFKNNKAKIQAQEKH